MLSGFLREAEAGTSVKDLCRKHGFSEASYYLWRCVLVVRIERAGRVGYWFEIETRPTEGGVLSPYFYDLGQYDQEVIQHLIESIARAEGRNLRQAAATALEAAGRGNAQCYRHHYRGEQSSELDVNSLRRFFARCDS